MAFSDYTDRLDRAVMEHLADTQSATYTPAAGDIREIPVIVSRDLERTIAGMNGAVMEVRTEIAAYSRDLGTAKRGDVIAVDGIEWRLVSVYSNDGAFVTWIVKENR